MQSQQILMPSQQHTSPTLADDLQNTISLSSTSPEDETRVDSHHDFQIETADVSSATLNGTPERTKPKQKRNKPTLSCYECVERKTKCDRGRPCVACIKRSTSCEYTAVANLLASSTGRSGHTTKSRYMNKPPSKIRKISNQSPELTSPTSLDNGWTHIDNNRARTHHGPHASPDLLSLKYSKPTPSNVFGIGAQHPFSNYWTCQGGLPEVISVLPSKDQSDILVAKYFEAVDPVYPFLHRRSFYADYERFWSLNRDEQAKSDPSLLALYYSVYALGTQFLPYPAYEERSQTAEFYCSAAHQALRVYSYLNRTSMRAISAMMLITYFLMNDNHTSDAYPWAGIHLRQAYAMRLHRNPDIVVPEASVLEKQQRRKLWQAIFFHDTFLTILLKLPPTATHSDVPVDSLTDENEFNDDYEVDIGAHSRVENLMSISVIAPQDAVPPLPPQPHHIVDPQTKKNDVAYIRSMWHLAELVQETVSSPNSLSLPLANSPRHREQVITAYRRLFKSFPAHLTLTDFASLQQRVLTEPRTVRQNLFLISNYYHCMMLLQASENEAGGVECNVKASLEAAHEAIWAFFKLWQLFPIEAAVWWVFQHRAFEESLLIAHLLSSPHVADQALDPLFVKAKEDVVHMLSIMDRYGGALEMHENRKTVLRESFGKIVI